MRVSALLVTACTLSLPASALAGSFTDVAEDWLDAPLFESKQFSMDFRKSKVSFGNCRQRTYQLALESQITTSFSIEARLNYGKGRTQYGALNQTVSTRGYDIVSWWNAGDMRIGLGRSAISDHEINTPSLSGFGLPTSEALSVEMEFAGLSEAHQVSLSMKKETWHADNATLYLPWKEASENKLEMTYSIAF